MSSSKVDRFTSNQKQSDQRSILQISSNPFHQRKYFALWYLSVCLSVTHFSFTLHWEAAESLYFFRGSYRLRTWMVV